MAPMTQLSQLDFNHSTIQPFNHSTKPTAMPPERISNSITLTRSKNADFLSVFRKAFLSSSASVSWPDSLFLLNVAILETQSGAETRC